MSRDFIPGPEAELATYATNFSTRISSDPSQYALSPEQATLCTTRSTGFVSAYQAAQDPTTRSPAQIVRKDLLKTALISTLRELARIVQASPLVSDEQKAELGLTIRNTDPSPIAPPAVAPGTDVVSVVARTVTVHVHDTASSSKRGKPAGAVAAWVYTFVGAEYPSDLAAWEFQGATTRSTHQITFADTLPAGQQVWIRAAWINAKQQAGPLSQPITTNLQGGGSLPEAA